MPISKTLDRLQRLDLLEARLKSDEPLKIREIAEEFGVSERTLGRDIEVLKDRGLPIETDRGRGGGVRLHWSWGIGRLSLSYKEAVDLLVSLAIVEQMESPIVMANLMPIRRKLMASFSPKSFHQIKQLKSRILIAKTASLAVQSGFVQPDPQSVGELHEAFLRQRALRISYVDANGAKTTRTVEPHFLLLSYPVWYSLSWDQSKDAARTLRCDRMLSARMTEDSFALREIDNFRDALEGYDFQIP